MKEKEVSDNTDSSSSDDSEIDPISSSDEISANEEDTYSLPAKYRYYAVRT